MHYRSRRATIISILRGIMTESSTALFPPLLILGPKSLALKRQGRRIEALRRKDLAIKVNELRFVFRLLGEFHEAALVGWCSQFQRKTEMKINGVILKTGEQLIEMTIKSKMTLLTI